MGLGGCGCLWIGWERVDAPVALDRGPGSQQYAMTVVRSRLLVTTRKPGMAVSGRACGLRSVRLFWLFQLQLMARQLVHCQPVFFHKWGTLVSLDPSPRPLPRYPWG